MGERDARVAFERSTRETTGAKRRCCRAGSTGLAGRDSSGLAASEGSAGLIAGFERTVIATEVAGIGAGRVGVGAIVANGTTTPWGSTDAAPTRAVPGAAAGTDAAVGAPA